MDSRLDRSPVSPPRTTVDANRMVWLAILVIIAVTCIALGRVIRNEFVNWDDPMNISENPHLRSIGYCWTHAVEGFYIPVTYSVWGLLAIIGGESPRGVFHPAVFHAANLAFHLISAIGVLLVLRRLGLRLRPATLGAIIFAIHPLQSETIAWATGLRDVLSGGICIWSLWAYLEAMWKWDRRERWWPTYWLATALYIVALLSKPQAVCLVVVVLAVEFLQDRLQWKRLAVLIGPWLILAIGGALLTHFVQPVTQASLASRHVDRPLIASDALLFYLRKVIAPTHLTVDYVHTTARLLQTRWHAALWLVPPVVIALVWTLRKRAPLAAVAVCIFIAALLPVLGLTPFSYQWYSNVANHYAYFAMIGPALLGGLVVQLLTDRFAEGGKFAVALAAGLLIAGMMADTFKQAGYWKDDLTLFSRNLQLQPESFLAHDRVASDFLKLGRMEDAIALFREALVINPTDGEVQFKLANALYLQGRFTEAIDHYQSAMKAKPNAFDIHENLGAALAGDGRVNEAIEELRVSNRLKPNNPNVLTDLGTLLMRQHDPSARQYFLQALAANPDFAPARAKLQQMDGGRDKMPAR